GELGLAGDGVDPLAGVGVGVLDDGDAAHALHPKGDLVARDVPDGLGGADGEAGGVELGVVEVVGLGGEGLVAAAGEADDDRVEDHGAGDRRDAGPRAVGDVAEGGANGLPGGAGGG